MSNVLEEPTIEVEPENILVKDGVRYDADTGEVLSAEFMIDSLDRAEWLTQKVGHYEHDLKTLEEQYQKDMARIKRERDGLLNFFAPQLSNYCLLKQQEAGGKGKVSLRYGEMSFIKRKAYYKVVDADVALQFAKEHVPELVEHIVPPEYDKLNTVKYKELAQDTSKGVWPGTDLIPESVDSYLKLGDAGKLKLSEYGLQRGGEELSLDDE